MKTHRGKQNDLFMILKRHWIGRFIYLFQFFVVQKKKARNVNIGSFPRIKKQKRSSIPSAWMYSFRFLLKCTVFIRSYLLLLSFSSVPCFTFLDSAVNLFLTLFLTHLSLPFTLTLFPLPLLPPPFHSSSSSSASGFSWLLEPGPAGLFSFFHFMRLFWNQILICLSVRHKAWAISMRRLLVK